jgi:hypothetical protein
MISKQTIQGSEQAFLDSALH